MCALLPIELCDWIPVTKMLVGGRPTVIDSTTMGSLVSGYQCILAMGVKTTNRWVVIVLPQREAKAAAEVHRFINSCGTLLIPLQNMVARQ